MARSAMGGGVVGGALAALSVMCGAALAAGVDETQRFDDWQMKCTPDHHACLISQLISAADTNNQVLWVAVGYERGRQMPTISFSLPPQILSGKGIKFTIDTHQTLDLPVDKCDAQRCLAEANLRQEILDQLSGGKSALVTFIVPGNKRLGINISLNGFAPAFKALDGGKP